MADLNAEIDDADTHNDPARAELAQVELDALPVSSRRLWGSAAGTGRRAQRPSAHVST
jgi:hypothetical protein